MVLTVLQNDREIISFPYRSGLPIDSMRRICVVSVNNQSAQDAKLAIKFVCQGPGKSMCFYGTKQLCFVYS